MPGIFSSQVPPLHRWNRQGDDITEFEVVTWKELKPLMFWPGQMPQWPMVHLGQGAWYVSSLYSHKENHQNFKCSWMINLSNYRFDNGTSYGIVSSTYGFMNSKFHKFHLSMKKWNCSTLRVIPPPPINIIQLNEFRDPTLSGNTSWDLSAKNLSPTSMKLELMVTRNVGTPFMGQNWQTSFTLQQKNLPFAKCQSSNDFWDNELAGQYFEEQIKSI